MSLLPITTGLVVCDVEKTFPPKTPNIYIYMVYIVGLSFLVLLATRVIRYTLIHHVLPAVSWDRFRGSWAVITGASEGIDLAFARSCARRGEEEDDVVGRMLFPV